MNINIICVGRLKEKYWADAVGEYSKRLSRYVNLKIIELADEKAPETMSDAQKEMVLEKEGARIIKSIPESSFAVTLEIGGKSLSSEELAEFLSEKMLHSVSSLTFIIGGSLGLSHEVIKRAGFHLSFSRMTFPHQMMRVILLEQIYRAEKIICNEPYHK
ncbi:23S rRNA (pseudouridine(1915)-N(3))-methyltransferase RlmH [Lachnospiraceae bacterium NSJ-143]|nr:23S rRNA (pseudouridine(1915)-N(3))-methyltransferase RlmH [Lachnospiraceae bacterium NSJ-143]